MFEKSLSQVTKLEGDLTQAKTDLERLEAQQVAARAALADALADAGASKAVITKARKEVSDLAEAVKAKAAEITELEAAIPRAREAAVGKAEAEFTEAVQAALDATDIPVGDVLAALHTVTDLADRLRAAWQNYSATTCAWMEHFPSVPTPPHAQPPEKRLNFQAAIIDGAQKIQGAIDYANMNCLNG